MSADDENERREYSQPHLEPYKNETRLRELYHEQGLTQYEIAERFGIDQSTVSYWFDKLGIQTESQKFYRSKNPNGHLQLQSENGESVYVHQMVALLEHDPERVFHDDTHVHHLMAAPHAVDLPENLEVLDAGEHARRHAHGTATDDPEKVLQHVFDEFELQPTPPDTDERATTPHLRHWSNRIEVSNDGECVGRADD